MSVQFRIVKIVPPSCNYFVRHLVALKQLEKMKLTALSWIWPRNRLLSIPYLHPCWSSALMSSLLVITEMVSILLESGHFPSAWKEALVRPILNWEEWSWHCFQELLAISKVTERAVFLLIDNHMKKLQSAYRKNHVTETAILKATNDILVKMNSQHGVYLCYLTWALPLTLMIIMFCCVDFKLHLEFLEYH